MIKDWGDFNDRRVNSLLYHSEGPKGNYENCLNYFELVRKYFETNGFPVKEENYENGKPKSFTDKESKKQREEIQKWIRLLLISRT